MAELAVILIATLALAVIEIAYLRDGRTSISEHVKNLFTRHAALLVLWAAAMGWTLAHFTP